MWGEAKADELLAAAAETRALWAGELDYPVSPRTSPSRRDCRSR